VTIDKVANSLPTRGNIELEIYGMEGIPEADQLEHEKQKQMKGSLHFVFKLNFSSVGMVPNLSAIGPRFKPGSNLSIYENLLLKPAKLDSGFHPFGSVK